ncbi:hypothetical protein POPA111323_02000 [Polynucleobacter paneuropaeus]
MVGLTVLPLTSIVLAPFEVPLRDRFPIPDDVAANPPENAFKNVPEELSVFELILAAKISAT